MVQGPHAATISSIEYLKETGELTYTILDVITDYKLTEIIPYSSTKLRFSLLLSYALEGWMSQWEIEQMNAELKGIAGRFEALKEFRETVKRRHGIQKLRLYFDDKERLKTMSSRAGAKLEYFLCRALVDVLAAKNGRNSNMATPEPSRFTSDSAHQPADQFPFQHYFGTIVFQSDVITNDDVQVPAGQEIYAKPLQTYSGTTVFHGRVITENRIRIY